MSFSFEGVDTSNFVCLQMKDSSVYFGEIAWVDEKGNFVLVISPDKPQDHPNIRRIRHGIGVQLFGTSDEGVMCKYEGYWKNDKKHGLGICTYPDKSVYNGNMVEDVRIGYGKYTWPNGDVYDGNWKEEKMEGGGKFYHHGGNVLQGVFKNNYFYQGNGVYINPFLSKQELDILQKRNKDIHLAKEITKKNKVFIFEKTNSYEKVAELIKKSNANKRVPIILATRDMQITRKDVYRNLSKASNRDVVEFDLRQAALLKDNHDDYAKFMRKTKNDLASVFAKGNIFVINFDDTDQEYKEIFDPDIREFYDPSCFPSQILDMNEIHKFEINDQVIMNSDFRTMRAGSDFNIAIWSKFRLNSDLENSKLLEKFERRFGSVLPVIKLDLIILV